ncbi:unnamed protein product [Vitrella brassicaformis CCMP3155]|uniref:PLD phosphodiesterase domain-containing protein n=1 Tax=Vitrella brassicaformis (strain CCMP3155) TaxID=1169540 RepID=A0A0G4G4A1_VITBC|nr:unnamed protein product [Vitrella brassicaformis CCMP3155]|eukprot:CEM22732.1 unnamed protein product [Vitrella brassicaformis CCMP3155]
MLTDPKLAEGSEIIFTGYKMDVHTRLLGAQERDDNPPLSELFEKLIKRKANVYVTFWQNLATFVADAATHSKWNVNQQAKELDKMGVRVFLDVGTERGSSEMANSNHMKSLIINRRVAFIGGIDIGPGRMDSPQHQQNNPSRYASSKQGELQKPWQDIDRSC